MSYVWQTGGLGAGGPNPAVDEREYVIGEIMRQYGASRSQVERISSCIAAVRSTYTEVDAQRMSQAELTALHDRYIRCVATELPTLSFNDQGQIYFGLVMVSEMEASPTGTVRASLKVEPKEWIEVKPGDPFAPGKRGSARVPLNATVNISEFRERARRLGIIITNIRFTRAGGASIAYVDFEYTRQGDRSIPGKLAALAASMQSAPVAPPVMAPGLPAPAQPAPVLAPPTQMPAEKQRFFDEYGDTLDWLQKNKLKVGAAAIAVIVGAAVLGRKTR